MQWVRQRLRTRRRRSGWQHPATPSGFSEFPTAFTKQTCQKHGLEVIQASFFPVSFQHVTSPSNWSICLENSLRSAGSGLVGSNEWQIFVCFFTLWTRNRPVTAHNVLPSNHYSKLCWTWNINEEKIHDDMIKLTSGVNRYFRPREAPGSVKALIRNMVSTRYGKVAVTYTAWKWVNTDTIYNCDIK